MIGNFKSRDHYFLSNFFVAPFEVDGVWYNTVEHYYQSRKTEDRSEQAAIRSAPTPSEAKALGLKATIRSDWNEVRIGIMRWGVLAKFQQNPVLLSRLLDTGDEYLREGNHWSDKFWGVDERTGQGENWLGRILMEVRDQLQRRPT
jgi:ribA/ribD-fused uncharacterized protein